MILSKETARVLVDVMNKLDAIGASINQQFHEQGQSFTVQDIGGMIRVKVDGHDREVFESRHFFEQQYGLVEVQRSKCIDGAARCGWSNSASAGKNCEVCGEFIPF